MDYEISYAEYERNKNDIRSWIGEDRYLHLAIALATREGNDAVLLTDESIKKHVETAQNRRKPSVLKVRERVVLEIARRSRFFGDQIGVNDLKLEKFRLGLATDDELTRIQEWLQKSGTMESEYSNFVLTESGWREAEDLQRPNRQSQQGFVAMPFGRELEEQQRLSQLFDHGFKPGIEFVDQEASDPHFRAIRIDKVEHNNKICDEIVAEIRRSRFLVADLTGSNPNVLWEAGYAQGLGLPVIFTCDKSREDDLQKLPFDIRQYLVIDYQTAGELAKRLTDRIGATIS